jgi:hypothetical protein
MNIDTRKNERYKLMSQVVLFSEIEGAEVRYDTEYETAVTIQLSYRSGNGGWPVSFQTQGSVAWAVLMSLDI